MSDDNLRDVVRLHARQVTLQRLLAVEVPRVFDDGAGAWFFSVLVYQEH